MKESDDMNLGIETETLEFKRSTGELKEAVHSICAILNKHQCGELYFGVKTDGTVIGQVVTEESPQCNFTFDKIAGISPFRMTSSFFI